MVVYAPSRSFDKLRTNGTVFRFRLYVSVLFINTMFLPIVVAVYAMGEAMKTIEIDCIEAKTESEFWQLYIDVVKPSGHEIFGRNFDAFWDAVEGGGPGWPGEVQLIFKNISHLRSLKLKNGSLFLDALAMIARDCSSTRIELVT